MPEPQAFDIDDEDVSFFIKDDQRQESVRARRGRIGCDLLLARLYRHHPKEAGVIHRVKDIELVSVPLPLPVPPPPPGAPPPSPPSDAPPPNAQNAQTANVAVLPVSRQDTEEALIIARPSLKHIIETVAKFYRLTVVEMMANRRDQELVRPRQVAMYLCRRLTMRSLPEIARMMGGRDHTTIMHGDRKIRKLVAADERLRDEIDVLLLRLHEDRLNPAAHPAPADRRLHPAA